MGHELRLWPMLSLLLIVVLAPTACLLWFMNRAIENERLAVRKTLEDAYRRDLSDAQARLEQFWQDREKKLQAAAEQEPPAAVFAECVRSGWADSVVCYDNQGRVTYPAAADNPGDQTDSNASDWAEARRLEYVADDPAAAARAYAAIARSAGDVNRAARALQAQARCLVQSGDNEAAIKLIIRTLADEKYARAVDPQGRLIVPNAELLALQLTADRDPDVFKQLAGQLQKRLEDYSDPAMSGAQRLFLMRHLEQLLGGKAELPLLPAEELAARFIEQNPSTARQAAILQAGPLPGIWQFTLPGGRLTSLWRTEKILSQSEGLFAERALPGEVSLALKPPGDEGAKTEVFYTLPAGKYLPGWQLALSWTAGDLADAGAKRRIAIYLWTGILVIAAICLLAGLMAQVFSNQLRYARLKNDLVATVSHELKTPLSSIRLLVDTLLDDRAWDLNKTREYLQLIAKENMRLSRLIDNFLTFSRMERKKQAFQFTETSPARAINEAVESVRERFEQPGCRLQVDVAADLPSVMADADALITVILNLLDNAYKYTGQQKQIALRAYVENGNVCIAVSDNGIGLSRAAAKKVFERFYQVDRRLSRNTGGCGLGLSIVKFIVAAHGGTVEVASRPGLGSTFTIKLPSPLGREAGGEDRVES
jgi:signal transduction histidine kinase